MHASPPRLTARFEFRCMKSDQQAFRKAAFRDGFSGNVSAWLLWHLRRAAAAKENGAKTL